MYNRERSFSLNQGSKWPLPLSLSWKYDNCTIIIIAFIILIGIVTKQCNENVIFVSFIVRFKPGNYDARVGCILSTILHSRSQKYNFIPSVLSLLLWQGGASIRAFRGFNFLGMSTSKKTLRSFSNQVERDYNTWLQDLQNTSKEINNKVTSNFQHMILS